MIKSVRLIVKTYWTCFLTLLFSNTDATTDKYTSRNYMKVPSHPGQNVYSQENKKQQIQ